MVTKYVALCRKYLTFKNEPQYYSPYYNDLLLKRPRISFLKPIVIIDVKSAFLMVMSTDFRLGHKLLEQKNSYNVVLLNGKTFININPRK